MGALRPLGLRALFVRGSRHNAQNMAYFKHFWQNQGGNPTRCKVWENFMFTRGNACDILFARAGDAVPAGRGTRKAERLKNGKEESR